jgi:hypothetical protein
MNNPKTEASALWSMTLHFGPHSCLVAEAEVGRPAASTK